jgi:hypothetical protein
MRDAGQPWAQQAGCGSRKKDVLGAMRGPGESYSDAVLRLVKLEGSCR